MLVCETCAVAFADQGALDKHASAVHGQIVSFVSSSNENPDVAVEEYAADKNHSFEENGFASETEDDAQPHSTSQYDGEPLANGGAGDEEVSGEVCTSDGNRQEEETEAVSSSDVSRKRRSRVRLSAPVMPSGRPDGAAPQVDVSAATTSQSSTDEPKMREAESWKKIVKRSASKLKISIDPPLRLPQALTEWTGMTEELDFDWNRQPEPIRNAANHEEEFYQTDRGTVLAKANNLSCNVCGRGFPSDIGLRRHMKYAHPDAMPKRDVTVRSEEMVGCPVCASSFRKQEFLAHFGSQHAKVRLFSVQTSKCLTHVLSLASIHGNLTFSFPVSPLSRRFRGRLQRRGVVMRPAAGHRFEATKTCATTWTPSTKTWTRFLAPSAKTLSGPNLRSPSTCAPTSSARNRSCPPNVPQRPFLTTAASAVTAASFSAAGPPESGTKSGISKTAFLSPFP